MKSIPRICIILLIFGLITIPSCKDEDPNPCPEELIFHRGTNILSIDARSIDQFELGDTFQKAYILSIAPNYEFTDTQLVTSERNSSGWWDFSLIESAYANSEVEPIRCALETHKFILNTPIKRASVHSSREYDPVHGTDVSTLIKWDLWLIESGFGVQRDFEEFWKKDTRQSGRFYLSSFNGEIVTNTIDTFRFYIESPPSISDSFSFTVILEDTLGRVHTATTDPIYIPSK